MAKMNELSILLEEAAELVARFDENANAGYYEVDYALLKQLEAEAMLYLRDITALMI